MSELEKSQTADQWSVVIEKYPILSERIMSFGMPQVTRYRVEGYSKDVGMISTPGRPCTGVEVSMGFSDTENCEIFDTLVGMCAKGEIFSCVLKMLPSGKEYRYDDMFIETINQRDLAHEDNARSMIYITAICNRPHPWNKIEVAE